MKARYYLLLVCTLLWGAKTYTQSLCPSTALVPVFKQDFGTASSSTSRSDVPAGFNTNYQFQASGALNDGYHMVTARVQNAQRNDWAVGGDHTGGTNGNMFLVNAGTGAALFFSQQVDNLCPGSTYSFSAWLANVNTTSATLPVCNASYVYPNVTFRIKNTSGTILESYSTGNLPLTASLLVPPNWQQYGFSFTLPSGTTSLILEMVDAHGGVPQCGNDLAIDDIMFAACTPTATASFSTSSSVCAGTNSSMDVSLVNSPFTTPAYQWQKSDDGGSTWNNIGTAGTGATSFPLNNVSTTDAGMYRVLVGPDVASLSSNTCITASNSITLTVHASPTVSVGSNSPVCSGNSINLSSSPSGGTSPYSYGWTGPNGFTSAAANPSIPNVAAVNAGTYSLTITDNNSCPASNSTSVTVNTTPTVAAITGAGGGCAGTTIALGNATPGGSWSSSNTSIATVDASTGLVSIITAGTFTVTYTVTSNGCSASATKLITAHSVTLPPSVIECSSATINTQTHASYSPTYSNNDPSSTYLWTITPAPHFQGGSGNTDRFPQVQYPNPSAYNVLLQFTSGGVTCSATQTVYRNGVEASGSINGPETESVCNNANTISLSATVAAYTDQYAWTTNGTGTFSHPDALNTTYTFSAADKTNGQVIITFTGSSSLNINGSCIDNTDVDTKTVNIELPNTGTNTTGAICSNQLFSHTSSSSVAGSTFTWVSSVLSGTGSGNATSGSGNINNTLTNLSPTTDFVVEYTVTPSNNGCAGTPYTVTVTVKPLPSLSITNNASSICTGSSTNIQLSDILTGTQYSWASAVITGTAGGNGNNTTPSATNTINDVLLNTTHTAATVQYSVTAHSTAGCTAIASTDVTVYPQPTTANADPDQSLCNVSAATLNGNTPASGTGTWTLVSGPNTPVFTNPASPSSTVTGLTTGTYVFRWSIGNGICAASEDDVIVLVSPVTVAGSLSADGTVCAPVNNGTLSVTGYTGNIINWQTSTDNGATWSTSTVTDPDYPFTNLNTTTLFKASVQSGSCSVLFSNTVTISVLQPPTAANAGPDEQRNGISSTTLAGNDPVHGTGTWTQISGPNSVSFSNASSYNSSVTGLIVGTYVLRWTITNGSCGSSFDEMQLIVDPPTDAGTLSADATVCATGGNGGTLTLSGYVGNILRWQYSDDNGNNWTDIANTTDEYIYSNLTTTTWFRAEVQNGTDDPEFSSHVTITVLQPVTVAHAGGDQTLCDLTAANLAANDPVSGTGTWSFVSGPTGVSFNNLNDHNSSVSGLIAGTYRLKWTVANGVCPSSEDEVDIVVVAPTNPGTVTADATVCATSNGGTLTISGFTGNVVHGEYSIDNGLNWTVLANTNNTTSIPYANLPVTTQFRALVQNSVCPAVHSNIVTITVLQPVTVADAGTDQQLCAANSATLAANNPSSGTGTWTQVSGPNTATFTNAGAYNTAVNGLATGTYVFRWTISNGACTPSQDEVTITVHPSTVAGSISGTATVCSGNNNGTLTLNGNTGLIVRWEYSTDGGAGWTHIAHNTSTYDYDNLTVTTLYKASVQSGVCSEQYTNNVLITVNPVTVPGTVTGGATVCTGNNNGTLSLSGNNGTVVRWEYSTDGGSNWTSIANTALTQHFSNLTATTQYRALVQNGVCAAAYSNAVTVTVTAATVAGSLSSPAIVCSGNNSGTLALSGSNGNIIRWEYSTDGGNTWSFISNTTHTQGYTNISTATDYRAVVQNGVCASDYSNIVSLSINPVTVAGSIQGATTVCTGANSGTLTLSGHTGSVLQWEYSTDGTNWTTIPNTSTSQHFSNLVSTTQYRTLVQNGVCAPAYTNPVTVTISPSTVTGALSGAATVCAGTNSGTLTLSGHNGSIIRWEYSTDGGGNWNIISYTQAAYTFNNLHTTTQYRALVQSGVCASQYSNAIAVTVNANTFPGSLLGNATVCTGSNTGTVTLSGNNGNIIQWEYSTDGTHWTGIAHTGSAYNYNNLTQETQYRAVVQNGVCAPTPSNSITVVINDNTIPGSVSGNAVVCHGSNNGTLTLSGYTGGVVQWESSTDGGNTWSQIVNAADQYAYSDLTAATLFRSLVKNGVCPAQYSGASAITVLPPPTTADAGPAQVICNSSAATLSANTPVYGTGRWTLVSGAGASIADPELHSTGITGLQTGTYVFAWTISNTVCPVSSANVNIEVLPPVSNSIGIHNVTVCAGQQVNIQGMAATGGNGAYQYQWETSADGVSWTSINGATAAGYSFAPAGNTLLRRIATSHDCATASAPVSVTVQPSLAGNTITGNQDICDGATTTGIKGTLATGGDGSYSYQWEQSRSSSGISVNNWEKVENATGIDLPEIKLRTTTSFRRIVTTALCNGPQALPSNVVTVNVKPLPEISLQYKAGTYCSKDSVIEFTSITNNVDSIHWDFGDGSRLTTGAQKITHRYSQPGVFVPRLQLISAGNCSVSVTAQDTIRIEDIKPGFRMSGVYECGKTFYRFVDTSQSYFRIARRTWLIHDIQVADIRDYQHLFTSAGEYDAQLQVQSVYGCVNTVSARFGVALFQFPKADIKAVNEACRNTLLEFRSNESAVDSIIIRSWDMGNGTKAYDSVVNAMYTSPGMYGVKLTVATVNKCYDSALKLLKVYPTPTLQLPAQQVMCKGDSLQLKANGAVNYIWKDENNNVICNDCPLATVQPQHNAQYKVIGYSEFGCSEMASTTVRVISPLTITAKQLDTLCIGSSKRLVVSGADRYTWMPAEGLTNLNSPSPVVSPRVTTTYTVIGKDAHNCFADTAQIKLVVGNPTPVTVGKDTAILAGNSIQLRAVSPLPDIRKWRWEGADFSCLNCPAPMAKVVNDACISCTVTNQYGCTSSDTICIKTFCPTTEVFIPNAFTPDGDGINDRLFVQGKGVKLIKSFRVFTRWGEMVFEKTNFSPGDPSMGWDGKIRGKAATPDVFVYVCEVICEKGTPATFKGNTAIIK